MADNGLEVLEAQAVGVRIGLSGYSAEHTADLRAAEHLAVDLGDLHRSVVPLRRGRRLRLSQQQLEPFRDVFCTQQVISCAVAWAETHEVLLAFSRAKNLASSRANNFAQP